MGRHWRASNMCKNDSLRGSGKAFKWQWKNKDTKTAMVCRQTRCYEGMLIGDGYAIMGNVEEVKGDKKALKLVESELKGDGEVLKSDEKVPKNRYLAMVWCRHTKTRWRGVKGQAWGITCWQRSVYRKLRCVKGPQKGFFCNNDMLGRYEYK